MALARSTPEPSIECKPQIFSYLFHVAAVTENTYQGPTCYTPLAEPIIMLNKLSKLLNRKLPKVEFGNCTFATQPTNKFSRLSTIRTLRKSTPINVLLKQKTRRLNFFVFKSAKIGNRTMIDILSRFDLYFDTLEFSQNKNEERVVLVNT